MYVLVIENEQTLLKLARENGLKVLNLKEENFSDFVNIEKKFPTITDFLCAMGIKPNLSGFRYLRFILENDFDYSHGSITTIIYPAVAKEFQTSPLRVERAIRHAIDSVSHTRSTIQLYEKIFVNFREQLTNHQFISGCKIYLQQNLNN